jgi:hypothetical protein
VLPGDKLVLYNSTGNRLSCAAKVNSAVIEHQSVHDFPSLDGSVRPLSFDDVVMCCLLPIVGTKVAHAELAAGTRHHLDVRRENQVRFTICFGLPDLDHGSTAWCPRLCEEFVEDAALRVANGVREGAEPPVKFSFGPEIDLKGHVGNEQTPSSLPQSVVSTILLSRSGAK